MGPVKFGDISKTATEVLDDDHFCAGYQLKSKAKTNFDGAVVTTTVDLGGGAAVKTPAKLSWKFPKPFGIAGFAIDKFEMDKSGGIKVESSFNNAAHTIKDLKVDVKTNLVDFPDKATVGCVYTGIADTMVTVETTPTPKAAQNFSLELMRGMGALTIGAKLKGSNPTAPDVGMRYVSGPLFVSLMATSSFGAFTGYGFYKISDELKLAAIYGHSLDGKAKVSPAGLGLAYTIQKGTSLKAKVLTDNSVHATVKHSLAGGFNVLAGIKYNIKSGDSNYGVQVSLE